MNEKQKELYRILDLVVSCCVTEHGRASITRSDILGRSRTENAVMTRCILVAQLAKAGFSASTSAQLLGRTSAAIRHLMRLGTDYLRTSRAYRIAFQQASRLCQEQDNEKTTPL